MDASTSTNFTTEWATTSLWTKLSFCFGGLITLFQLFHTPCKVRKLPSHQRNSGYQTDNQSGQHVELTRVVGVRHWSLRTLEGTATWKEEAVHRIHPWVGTVFSRWRSLKTEIRRKPCTLPTRDLQNERRGVSRTNDERNERAWHFAQIGERSAWQDRRDEQHHRWGVHPCTRRGKKKGRQFGSTRSSSISTYSSHACSVSNNEAELFGAEKEEMWRLLGRFSLSQARLLFNQEIKKQDLNQILNEFVKELVWKNWVKRMRGKFFREYSPHTF
jgi:hypothetical protein